MLKWLEEMQSQYRAGTAHAFLLYGNIADDFLADGEFMLLHQVLAKKSPVSDSAIVAFYNREAGVWFPGIERIPAETMRGWFVSLAVEPHLPAPARVAEITADEFFQAHKKELSWVLVWFGEILRISWVSEKVKDESAFQEYRPKDKKTRVPFATVIFEHLESKLPPDSAGSGSEIDRVAFDTFPQWGRQNLDIRETGNIIVVQSETFSSVAHPVKNPLSGFYPIEIPIAKLPGQREIVEAIRKEIPRQENDIDNEQLAKLATGMPCIITTNLVRQARAQGRELDVRLVSDRKSKQIKEQSGGILAARRPPYGFESAGSLDYAVRWAQEIVDFMIRGETSAIPKGAIFLGPPGTGKTLLAEAIAHEADIPFITFEENVRNSFVGESEHRLELVLKVIRANAPCIWFWDEIDKYLRNPDEVYQGDAYVSSNIQGMLLEFFSDPTIQGSVFVLGATNEPERLSPAMIRTGRFDDKIAFLIPKKDQRPGIFSALFRKKKILGELRGGEFNWEVTDKDLVELSAMLDYYIDLRGKMRPGGPDAPTNLLDKQKVPLTGGFIEKVITYGWRLARRNQETVLTMKHLTEIVRTTLPGAETREYRRMNRNAILYVDSIGGIPSEYEEEWREIHGKPDGAS